MITLTPVAVGKIKEMIAAQNPAPIGIRIGVEGGGCSGFKYSMRFEMAGGAKEHKGTADNEHEIDGLRVFVDQMSEMYLDGVTVDYVEQIDASGFKFDNPKVTKQCGCGSSFSI